LPGSMIEMVPAEVVIPFEEGIRVFLYFENMDSHSRLTVPVYLFADQEDRRTGNDF